MECEEHPGSPMISVCITCDTTLVCVDCMTDTLHNGHVFKKPKTISNEIKTELKTKVTEVYKLEIDLESELKEFETLKTQQDKILIERTTSIETGQKVLINAVNEMTNTFKSEYNNQKKNNCNELQDVINDISTELKNVRQHREKVKRIIDQTDDLAVVHDSRDLKDFDGQRKPHPQHAAIKFPPGKLDSDQLKLVFEGKAAEIKALTTLQGVQAGTVIRQRKEPVLESTFKHSKSSFVTGMCYGSYEKSWVKCHDEKELILIDKHGHVDKTVPFDFSVRGMPTVSDDTLLLCGGDNRNIKQILLSSGKVTTVFSTGKLYPQYVCTAPSGDLYVTLTDKHDYNTTADSERILIQYSPKGREKGRARFDKRGDVLFVGPSTVMISNTGDVIGVTNDTDKLNSHLVLLNTDLTLRLRYLGNGKVVSGEEKFDTTTYKPETKYAINDFIFDSFDNIIFCEVYSKCVQLMSKDCVPLATLLPKQEYIPMSITMNGDRMWIGFLDGTVKIYQYK
ncbi:uncharacterized protein LOC110441100 [Mizuhopecten yessoensis]|uniref:uncharacterized protein LOC110441100 n=1 Tax=Mizuhopecten yessoensis TaxID=6573 RepID=UPI000B45C1C1|nr:uncharacterized protein LOC110441100 [Mizuhopecten yessoensis]